MDIDLFKNLINLNWLELFSNMISDISVFLGLISL